MIARALPLVAVAKGFHLSPSRCRSFEDSLLFLSFHELMQLFLHIMQFKVNIKYTKRKMERSLMCLLLVYILEVADPSLSDKFFLRQVSNVDTHGIKDGPRLGRLRLGKKITVKNANILKRVMQRLEVYLMAQK